MTKRLIAYLGSLLFPIAGYVFPIWLMQKDFCFNSTILRFMISPLVAALLLAVVIFSKRGRKWVKVLLSIGILILFVFFYLCNFMFGTFAYLDCYEQKQVQEPYTTVRESWECSWMPDLTQVGELTKITHYSYHAKSFIFLWEAEYLVCSYEPEEYHQQKANLENMYRFQTETLKHYDCECPPTATLDGYTFRFVDLDEYSWEKHVPLVGYSDEAHEIMYVNYYDADRDILTSLMDLLIEDCGWKFIR